MCNGEKFVWDNFPAPTMSSKRGWLLVGGLTPDNLGTTVSLVRPVAVDVSSGIVDPDGICKDFDRIRSVIKTLNNESLSGVWQSMQLLLQTPLHLKLIAFQLSSFADLSQQKGIHVEVLVCWDLYRMLCRIAM